MRFLLANVEIRS